MLIEVSPDTAKVDVCMVSMLYGKVIDVRLDVPRKAQSPIYVTELGIFIEDKLLQL